MTNERHVSPHINLFPNPLLSPVSLWQSLNKLANLFFIVVRYHCFLTLIIVVI